MFREPSRHDKVLRNAAGDDAGDVGGYSTNWTACPDRTIDRLHLWVLQKDVRAEVEWWMRRVRLEHGATTLGFAALSEMVTL